MKMDKTQKRKNNSLIKTQKIMKIKKIKEEVNEDFRHIAEDLVKKENTIIAKIKKIDQLDKKLEESINIYK
jgi:hypothetical protein